MQAIIIYSVLGAALLVGLSVWYLDRRLLRDAGIGNRGKARGVMTLVLCLALLTPALRYLYGYNTLTVVAMWIGWSIFGLLFLLITMLLVRDALLFAWDKARRSTDAAPADPARRQLFIRASNAAIGVSTAVVSANGAVAARRIPAVKKVRVPISGLPEQLESLNVVQLSDIHVGETIGRDWLQGVVNATMAERPDLILITGDLIDGTLEPAMRALLDPLDQLRAPLGVFYTTGNHEYYYDAEAWIEEVRGHGITPLTNEHRTLTFRGRRIVLAGVPDHDGGDFVDGHTPDVERAYQGAPAADLRLLMAHQPRSYPLAEGHDVDLQLSGHTHGGQIWPFGLLVPLQQRFNAGLHRTDDGMQVYVSRGTGYWGPPMRVGAPAEITQINFVRTD